jgi:hypothetical protein
MVGKESSSFSAEKEPKRLPLLWGMGCGAANAHAPEYQKFFGSFFFKKELLLFVPQIFTCVFNILILNAAHAATHVPLPHFRIVVTQRRQAFWQHDGGNLAVAGSLDRFVTRARRLR